MKLTKCFLVAIVFEASVSTAFNGSNTFSVRKMISCKSRTLLTLSADSTPALNTLNTNQIVMPDIMELRETLTSVFPAKTSAEIVQMTTELFKISSSVQQRGLDGDLPCTVISSSSALEGADFATNLFPYFPFEKFGTVFDNVQQMTANGGWTLSELMEQLDYEQLGVWYSAALGMLLLSMPTYMALTKDSFTSAEQISASPLVSNPDPYIAQVQASSVVSEEMKSLLSNLSQALSTLKGEVADLKSSKAKAEQELISLQLEYNIANEKMETILNTERLLKHQIRVFNRSQQWMKARMDFANKKADILLEQNMALDNEINFLANRPWFMRTPRRFIPAMKVVWFANLASARSGKYFNA